MASSSEASEHPSKKLIEQSYDLMAPTYLEWTSHTPSPRVAHMERLISLLPKSPRPNILELGCGAGDPGTMYLAQHATVTANDISSVQIAMAKQRTPSATFIHQDMMGLSFPPGTFDAVVAFYSIIHLPRTEQEELCKRLFSWVKEGGYLVANFGTVDSEKHTAENFLGQPMFWSGWDEEGNRKMVEGAGWKIVEAMVVEDLEKGTEGQPDRAVPFWWVLGKKGNGEKEEGTDGAP